MSDHSYYIFYKPYDVLNQFTKERPEHVTLGDYLRVEKDVYPVGRLDKDSEGMLILTNDKQLNEKLLSPVYKHSRTYFVQVDDDITLKAVERVAEGVEIKLDSGPYFTKPCKARKLPKAPVLPERNPPIRFRKEIPTSWVKIELGEGKNRQIRKMFAAVGFPVLRLVRVQIEDIKLGDMMPGQYKSLSKEEIYKLLHIDPNAKKPVKQTPLPTIKKTNTATSRPATKSRQPGTRKPAPGNPSRRTGRKK